MNIKDMTAMKNSFRDSTLSTWIVNPSICFGNLHSDSSDSFDSFDSSDSCDSCDSSDSSDSLAQPVSPLEGETERGLPLVPLVPPVPYFFVFLGLTKTISKALFLMFLCELMFLCPACV